jgi:hypothetical protein
MGKWFFGVLLLVLMAAPARGQEAASVYKTADFPISFTADAPGIVSAAELVAKEKPAGRHGAIVAREGHFFSGPNRIRFWGVNLCFSGNFPTHEQADALAKRFANFGINAVRFHHMDSSPFPGGIFADQSLTKLSEEALDRLDYFIAALKKEGIYSNLNLHVSRNYARRQKWENAEKLEQYDKIVDIFHPELIEVNKQFARDLLTHVNKYTNTRYADEPAICMVEINNEDTLFFWGGVQKLATLPEPYGGMLQKLWNQWLVEKYKSREGVLAAWEKEDSLGAQEDPASGTVARGLLKGQTASHLRSSDWYRFLQATDEKYFVEMREFLKKELGVKAPITGSIALGPIGALSQSRMDFVDAHAYWDHPRFPRRQWDMKDWEIRNTPMSGTPATAALWGLAASRVAGKPFTVTEYNHAAPNEYQAECIPMIASFAAMQDWDAVFLFSYSHNTRYQKPKMESFFDIEGNPLKMHFMPLGSRIFLGGAVTPLKDVTVVRPTLDQMLKTGAAYHSDVWGFVRRQEVSWETMLKSRFALGFDPDATLAAEAGPGPVAGLRRLEGKASVYSVVDERAVVITAHNVGDIDLFPLRLTGVKTPFVSLILVSEDGKPIRESQKLLLGLVGRGGNKDMGWDENRKTISDKWGSAPPQIEVIDGLFSLDLAGPYNVFPLTESGQRAIAPRREIQGNQEGFRLGSFPTLWYEIARQ